MTSNLMDTAPGGESTQCVDYILTFGSTSYSSLTLTLLQMEDMSLSTR